MLKPVLFIYSSGNTCNRDYTITCDANTPFKDDQTTKTLTCTASFAEYGGSFDTSQISDCGLNLFRFTFLCTLKLIICYVASAHFTKIL